MADVRALLKAKTKERSAQQTIQHEYAAYNASGQLRCSLCATLIKFNNPTTWKSHLESKGHKANLGKEKGKGKRKADDEMDVDSDGGGKKRRTDTTTSPEPGFPSDFFSDSTRKLPLADDDDAEDGQDIKQSKNPPGGSGIDDEFEAFERAIRAASSQRAAAQTVSQEVFSRATVVAEPELVDPSTLEADGFPPDVASNTAAAPLPLAATNGQPASGEAQEEETEAQKAKRKEMEEKELIMDRLLEEERAQEEADDRVKSLKARLEAIKRQRERKKQDKTKNP
ncbi:hypothetical protein FRB99_007293 [Tulasnella sp. 403]|nr:hypothetical protein FRB99_007293 [Tulasnella sp. 403]